MQFSKIPGLTDIKKPLIKGVKNNRVGHALLFFGRRGALTLPMALAYATYLHCEQRTETDACGVCPACQKNKKYIHPDTGFVFPLSNIKNDKNEERFRADILQLWRSFLLECPFGSPADWISYYGGENKRPLIYREQGREIVRNLSLKSFQSKHKVVVMWQPENMHPAAANGILKILEEPPPNTSFLLAGNAADKLLPTIRSRVQAIQIPLLSDEEMRLFLQKETAVDERQTKTILQLADGDPNRALQLVESGQDINRHWFVTWMRACFKRNYKQLVEMANEFHQSDKLTQQNLLQYSASMIREALICLAGATSISRVENDEATFIKDFSGVLNTPKTDQLNKMLSQASRHLEQNGSAKMIFLNLSLQCAVVLNPGIRESVC